MDALPSLTCSSPAIGPQEEENDDWVLVKKQKFTILIPPPSPPTQLIEKETTPKPSGRHPKAIKATPASKNRSHGQKCSKASAPVHGTHKNGTRTEGNGNMHRPPPSSHANVMGKIGAVNVVNLRIRAMNLEKKLEGHGGLRSFPPFCGLDRFVAFFEWRKLSRYQLANLTTGKLKEMGVNSVGRRRKLIHAIDLLCQPYYAQDFNNRACDHICV